METVHIDTVVGSVFGNVTQYITKEEISMKQEEIHVREEAKAEEETAVPPYLATEEASRLRERLERTGLVDAHWQPVGLTLAEKGVLVQYIAGQLGLDAQWQTFARLWGMKPETLRKAYGKGMEQRKTLTFLDRVKGDV